MEQVEAYKRHVIDQALTLLRAHENIKCLFTTPKLLEALCEKVSLKKMGIRGVFCGGTEMTPQFHRFAVEELLDGVYFAPTYGNTLMGLATHKPAEPEDNYAIIYYPPAPRAMIEVVDPDRPDRLVGYGETGRVRLDHAHQGVLHAAIPRARRGRTRAAVPAIPVGRRPQRPPVFAVRDDSGGGCVLVGSRRDQGSGIRDPKVQGSGTEPDPGRLRHSEPRAIARRVPEFPIPDPGSLIPDP